VDAFKIALETVFVGALAIPWLALTIQFFFPEASSWLGKSNNSIPSAEEKIAPSSGEDQIRIAVAGVLLTALAYMIGAGVGRVAEDFFNDDDLRMGRLRLVTEDHIRESVYCSLDGTGLVDPAVPQLCQVNLRYKIRDRIRQIFLLEESTLLLAGGDKTDRLRREHQRIMVLRGAALDGVLTCVLCLLGWNLAQQGWGLWRYLLPGVITLGVLSMFYYHLHLDDSGLLANLLHPRQLFDSLHADEPPSAELTFLILALGGFYLVRKGKPGTWQYAKGFWAAALATGLAYIGWYLTEIRYDELVIYSYYAQSHELLKLH